MTSSRQNDHDVRSLGVTYSDGHVLGWHSHDWGQLIYAVSGVMRVSAPEAAFVVPATRAVWAPAGTAHRIAMQGRVAMRTLYIAPHLTGRLAPGVRVVEVRPLLKELILHILTFGMLRAGEPPEARLTGLLIDLIQDAAAEDLWLPLPNDRRALAMAEMIQAAPDDRRRLGELARLSGASLRTLQRLFAAQTGLALDAWRQKARLVHGAALIANGAAVTNAAFDSGYDSVSAFIAAFRRQFGVTPGAWRAV